MEEILISVIVPVYNVEKYLCSCIDSIVSQTYRCLEIILIDDGSTDKSGMICDDYANKDKRVRVLHKTNGGATSARKLGMKSARGSYVLYIDSDDWIDACFIEEAVARIVNERCEIVVADMIHEIENTNEKVDLGVKLRAGYYDLTEEDNEVYKRLLVDDTSVSSMHGIAGKVILKELFVASQENVPNTIISGEDAACMYPCYLKANSVYFLGKSYYHYIAHTGSVLTTSNSNSVDNWISLYEYLRKECMFEDKEIQHIFDNNLKRFIYRRMYLNIKRECPDLPEFIQTEVTTKRRLYIFPYESIEANNKVAIYGAGVVGRDYYRQLENSEYCELVAIFDREKTGKLGNVSIQQIDKKQHTLFDYLVIAVKNKDIAEGIKAQLINDGIPYEKIVWKQPKLMEL